MRQAPRATIPTVLALGLAAAGCGTAGAPAPPTATSAATHAVSAAGAAVFPPAEFAKTVRLVPVSGTVLIRVPSATTFVRLKAAQTVAVGTVIDVRAGTVRLTSATAPPTKLQTGNFFLGRFQVVQKRSLGGLTDLVIQDKTKRVACSAQGQQASAAKLSARILGLLRGKAKGHFRTRGHFAAATVRGTEWGVRDRCDGTLTVVQKGVVAVRDFTLHKTVIVKAGQTYLAKAP
jgi:hypothetical protein